MSDYEYENADLADWGGDDFGDDGTAFEADPNGYTDVAYVPEAQPTMDVGYAPTLNGEQMVDAALALAQTPQAQQFIAEYQAAQEQADRVAAAPSIHAFIDAEESKMGVTADRHAVITYAEEILPDLVAERGANEETALLALSIAMRKSAGKGTYDDVATIHAARAKRQFGV